MGIRKSEQRREEEFVEQARAMYVRLRGWRAANLEASFDDLADQVTEERQKLMAGLLGELAAQPEEEPAEVEVCEGCGKSLIPKGKRERGVGHLEGEVRITREYHYCDECQSGLFPPGPQTEADSTRMEPTHN